MPAEGYVDIVDENDIVLYKASFEDAHEKGLRHRVAEVFVFMGPDCAYLLVAKRGAKSYPASVGKLNSSACGHVLSGEEYIDAAKRELLEELFCGHESLPEGMEFHKVARYDNETRPENREKACLFYAVHPGPFAVDGEEVASVSFENRHAVWEDVIARPDKYTTSFRNAVVQFRLFKGKAAQ